MGKERKKKNKEIKKNKRPAAITVSAACATSKMPCPQRIDVEETVPPDRCAKIANVVAVMMVAVMTPLGLAGLMIGASRRYFGLYVDVPIPVERFITDHPILVIGIPCAVLAVALCIKKLRAASRTGVNGDCENRGTAEVLDGSVEAGERGIVQPAIRTPPVVTIPSSSSSRSGGGVSTGHGVVTAADVELGRGGAITGQRGTVRGRDVT